MRTENVTVSIILGTDEIEKIDSLAGKGNRSAYIRCLIQHATGHAELQLMDLEIENRHLYSLLKEERAGIRKLKERLRKKGVKEGEKVSEKFVKTSMEFHQWKDKMNEQLGAISQDLKLSWLSAHAKEYNISVFEFMEMLDPKHQKQKSPKKTTEQEKFNPAVSFRQIKHHEKQKQSFLDE